MDELGVARTHLVGNSMGGRVAIEMGLRAPHRIRSLALLCPAVAFVRRGFHPIVRVLRPEFGMLPHRFSRSTVEKQFWSLFSDRDLVDPDTADVAVDEFQRIYASAGARYAFLSSARNIYLEKPFGRGGFYPRLAGLEPPALFVWTTGDKLIPAAFRSPRDRVAAVGRADHAAVLRPRAPGRAPRADQRPRGALPRPGRGAGPPRPAAARRLTRRG